MKYLTNNERYLNRFKDLEEFIKRNYKKLKVY